MSSETTAPTQPTPFIPPFDTSLEALRELHEQVVASPSKDMQAYGHDSFVILVRGHQKAGKSALLNTLLTALRPLNNRELSTECGTSSGSTSYTNTVTFRDAAPFVFIDYPGFDSSAETLENDSLCLDGLLECGFQVNNLYQTVPQSTSERFGRMPLMVLFVIKANSLDNSKVWEEYRETQSMCKKRQISMMVAVTQIDSTKEVADPTLRDFPEKVVFDKNIYEKLQKATNHEHSGMPENSFHFVKNYVHERSPTDAINAMALHILLVARSKCRETLKAWNADAKLKHFCLPPQNVSAGRAFSRAQLSESEAVSDPPPY